MAQIKVDTLSDKLCADNNAVYRWLLDTMNNMKFSAVEIGPKTGTVMWWDESVGSMRVVNYMTWFVVEVPDDKRGLLDEILATYAKRVEEAPVEAAARREAQKAAEEAEAAAKAERKRIREEKKAAKAAKVPPAP